MHHSLVGLIVLSAISFSISATARADSGLCGMEPEKYVCGYLPAASDFDRAQATARSKFENLRHTTMMAGYALAKTRCGLQPTACPGTCDPVLDPLDSRYGAAFDNSGDAAFRACVMQSMQAAVMNAIHANSSITDTQISAFFTKMKQNEVAMVSTDSAFTTVQKTDITHEINSTILVPANLFPPYVTSVGDAGSPFAFGCQVKLTPTAFLTYGYNSFRPVPWRASPTSATTTAHLPLTVASNNYLAACPGLYLELLNTTASDPFENWYRILGHELAHNFHAFLKRTSYIERGTSYDPATKNWNPNFRLPASSTYWSNYEPVLSCLSTHYLPGTSNADARDLIHSDVPDSGWSAKFKPITGHVADDLELHMIEYTAEYWGMKALAAMVQQKPEAERALAAYNGLKLLCPGPGMQSYMTADVDGTHPSIAFRIRMALRNPDLRQSIGCGATQAPFGGPWCDLSASP